MTETATLPTVDGDVEFRAGDLIDVLLNGQPYFNAGNPVKVMCVHPGICAHICIVEAEGDLRIKGGGCAREDTGYSFFLDAGYSTVLHIKHHDTGGGLAEFFSNKTDAFQKKLTDDYFREVFS